MLDVYNKSREELNEKYKQLVGTVNKRKSDTELEEGILSESKDEDLSNKKTKLDENKSECILNNKKLICMHAKYEK